jgi:hypothetical protein
MKGLSVESRGFQKLHLIHIKRVSLSCGHRGEKTRGGNMKDSLAMLMKTHGEKMSDNRSLAMLMIINELKSLSGDVDEKKEDINHEV